jgi:hypothetical protein
VWLELLISLFFAMGCAPLAFFWANCPCCGTFETCDYCDDSSDQAPTQVQVDISGMTSLVCTGSNCASMDGAYILTWTTAGVSSNCRWTYSFPLGTTFCTRQWTLNVFVSATELRGTAVDSFSLLTIVWQSSAAGFKNCTGWSAFNLPWATNANTQCSGGSSTFTVTKL